MDFIIKLSKSVNLFTKIIYNQILITINRLIKYNIIILFKKSYLIKKLDLIVLNQLIKNHRIFTEITINRESLFMFKY